MLLSLFCNYLYFSMSTSAYGYLPKPSQIKYRKILKISPGAYIFKCPLWGAYIRREVFVSKSARLILGGKFASQNYGGPQLSHQIQITHIKYKILTSNTNYSHKILNPDMNHKLLTSNTNFNERISTKNSLPYLKCVLRLSCVVHGPIYGRFMGFYVKVFSV